MTNLNDKLYIFLYKTVNIMNGKYYIGVHTTSKINDGYLGSGTLLKQSIKKHGRNIFVRYILEFFDTLELALQKESEVVNEQFVNNPLTYNLTIGGYSGTGYFHKGKPKTSETKFKMHLAQSQRTELHKKHNGESVKKAHQNKTIDERKKIAQKGIETRIKNGNNIQKPETIIKRKNTIKKLKEEYKSQGKSWMSEETKEKIGKKVSAALKGRKIIWSKEANEKRSKTQSNQRKGIRPKGFIQMMISNKNMSKETIQQRTKTNILKSLQNYKNWTNEPLNNDTYKKAKENDVIRKNAPCSPKNVLKWFGTLDVDYILSNTEYNRQ